MPSFCPGEGGYRPGMQPFGFDEGDEYVMEWITAPILVRKRVLEVEFVEVVPRRAPSWDEVADFFEVLRPGHLGFGCRKVLARPGAI